MKRNTLYTIILGICVLIGTGIIVFGTRLHDAAYEEMDILSEEELGTIRQVVWEEPDVPMLPHVDIQIALETSIRSIFGPSYIIVSEEGSRDVPFTFSAPQELLSNPYLSLHTWTSDDTFTFSIYDPNVCDFFSCEGDMYEYSLSHNAYTLIEEPRGTVSPSGRYVIQYNEDEDSDMFGSFVIEDQELGVRQNLGTALYMTGTNGQYIQTPLFSFAWSPDESMIAMLDASDWNETGPAVYILSRTKASIDAREYIGHVMYKETERPQDEVLITWSSDSRFLFAGDRGIIFDVSAKEKVEIDMPYPNLQSWSPNAPYILGIATSYGCSIVDVHERTAFGYVCMEHIDDVASIVREATLWDPHGRFVLVTTENDVYVIDSVEHSYGRIADDTLVGAERIIWSPDGTKIVSLAEGRILLRDVVR